MDNLWKKIEQGTFVIAEIGKGFIQTERHRSVAEYLENAKVLVKAAKDAGADAVKFQTHTVEDEQLDISVISPHFKGSDRYTWVTRNTNATPLGEFWKPLKAYCDKIDICFFSTPMSRGAATLLTELGVDVWKVGSGDILDFVLLDYLSATGKPVLISSGMSTLEELDLSMSFLKSRGVQTALFHCVSRYPCPPEELNLESIAFLRQRYRVPTGFSDHSLGVDSALAAVALGATMIEKHFSLDRTLWGSDHKVSMLPGELRELIEGVHRIESNKDEASAFLAKPEIALMLGTAGKVLQEDEAVFRPYFRKSLVAGQDIPVGTIIAKEMIYAMRPQLYAGGLPSEKYEEVVGRIAKVALKKYDPITTDTLI